MKKIVVAIFMSVMAVVAFAQTEFKQGHVSYAISVTGNSQAAQMMNGATMTISVQDTLSRTDMNLGMMQTRVIMNTKLKTGTMFMDMMGNKYAITLSPEDLKKQEEQEESGYDVKYIDSTKLIASHVCKKAIVVLKDSKKELTVWYDPSINITMPGKNSYSKIKGLPVQYGFDQKGIDMEFTLTEFDSKPVDNSLFASSTDGYTVMSMDDFLSSMGGQH